MNDYINMDYDEFEICRRKDQSLRCCGPTLCKSSTYDARCCETYQRIASPQRKVHPTKFNTDDSCYGRRLAPSRKKFSRSDVNDEQLWNTQYDRCCGQIKMQGNEYLNPKARRSAQASRSYCTGNQQLPPIPECPCGCKISNDWTNRPRMSGWVKFCDRIISMCDNKHVKGKEYRNRFSLNSAYRSPITRSGYTEVNQNVGISKSNVSDGSLNCRNVCSQDSNFDYPKHVTTYFPDLSKAVEIRTRNCKDEATSDNCNSALLEQHKDKTTNVEYNCFCLSESTQAPCIVPTKSVLVYFERPNYLDKGISTCHSNSTQSESQPNDKCNPTSGNCFFESKVRSVTMRESTQTSPLTHSIELISHKMQQLLTDFKGGSYCSEDCCCSQEFSHCCVQTSAQNQSKQSSELEKKTQTQNKLCTCCENCACTMGKMKSSESTENAKIKTGSSSSATAHKNVKKQLVHKKVSARKSSNKNYRQKKEIDHQKLSITTSNEDNQNRFFRTRGRPQHNTNLDTKLQQLIALNREQQKLMAAVCKSILAPSNIELLSHRDSTEFDCTPNQNTIVGSFLKSKVPESDEKISFQQKCKRLEEKFIRLKGMKYERTNVEIRPDEQKYFRCSKHVVKSNGRSCLSNDLHEGQVAKLVNSFENKETECDVAPHILSTTSVDNFRTKIHRSFDTLENCNKFKRNSVPDANVVYVSSNDTSSQKVNLLRTKLMTIEEKSSNILNSPPHLNRINETKKVHQYTASPSEGGEKQNIFGNNNKPTNSPRDIDFNASSFVFDGNVMRITVPFENDKQKTINVNVLNEDGKRIL